MKTKILGKKIVSGFVLLGLAVLLAASTPDGKELVKMSALPTTIILITNTNDSGPGSLRQALTTANDGDTIDFDSSLNGRTITLTSGQLIVDKSVTISGPGANLLAVDGNTNDRVFSINPGETVIISGLTITNGHALTGGNDGGGILNVNATLTVIGCILSGNSGNGFLSNGGGIANEANGANATLTVTNCTISGNSGGGGGGIANEANGGKATLTATNCTISGNSTNSNFQPGGGIESESDPRLGGVATVTISNSTISGNSTGGYVGGGIYGDNLTVSNSAISGNVAGSWGGGIFGGNLTVTNTTISGNVSGSVGGGIFGSSGPITVTNSTISGNSAISENSTGAGGGIGYYPLTGINVRVTVTNSTISGNSVDGGGGGIWNYGGTAMTVTNSTISANSAQAGSCMLIDVGGAAYIGDTLLNAGTSGGTIFTANFGTVTSLGYNLASDDGSGFLTGPGDQLNTDPMLGPLQDNGGPTFTQALLPGSPAINGGDPNFTPPPLYDQRGPGFDRVINSRIDIGSFEVQAGSTPTPTPTATATATPTSTPRPSVTPRPSQSPRPRPTPAPRP